MTPDQKPGADVLRRGAQEFERMFHQSRRDLGLELDDIAQALGVDESAACRILSGQYGIKLNRVGALLALMGLRAIPVSHEIVEVPREHYESMVQMCNIGAQSLSLTDFHPRYSRAADLRQPLVIVGAGQWSRGG